MVDPGSGRWSPIRHGLWIGMVMTALFSWMALLLLVHRLHGPDYSPGVVQPVHGAIRIALSLFVGLAIATLVTGRSQPASASDRPAPSRWQITAVVFCMILAWGIWLQARGLIAIHL